MGVLDLNADQSGWTRINADKAKAIELGTMNGWRLAENKPTFALSAFIRVHPL
jgi:hypothetical protein